MAEQSEQRQLNNQDMKEPKVDMELLNQAMEAFNSATEKLQTSYELLQDEARKLRTEVEDKNRKLSDISSLLESILNNTRSAILVVNESDIVIKNRAGDKLIDDIGKDAVMDMIYKYSSEGVYDHQSEDDMYFRISVGNIMTHNIHGAVYVMDDITNIKRLEKEKQHSRNLQIMGEMAANIAHDIRNPLGSMELYVSLLEREVGGNPEYKKLTSSVLKSIRIINGIISNTLLFAKDVHVKKIKYVLADIVDEVVLYLQHVLKEKKAVIVNKLNENNYVCCDKDLFRQVVMNIIHNAIDAVSVGCGVITLESYEDDNLHFSICDNGTGIAESIRNSIFMPFQTTKAKGTGLGLSIAYKIIKAHGGNIEIYSDGKSYTKFDIVMPKAEECRNIGLTNEE